MFPILFSGNTDPTKDAKPPLMLFDTLTRKKVPFTPIKNDYVRMYNCGPTVYDYIHIGNLRAFVFADILRNALLLNGYKVMQVMNITDIGHLVSDGDEGADKMTMALKREGKEISLPAMKELADRYAKSFIEDLEDLNIKRPSVMPKASEHVQPDIALIETLMQKEYAYRTSDGVYFDTARFPNYGKLGCLDIEGQKSGARVEVNEEKHNPADFALWKKNDEMGWDSPWGKGFPGWHIECSAMAMEYLGKEIDIHTGGIDLAGTHHNNEIAQSEAATNKPFARVWMHNEFVNIEGTKISKSLKNTISLKQLKEHGYNPLAYRYWLLTAHYRTKVNFSFAALDASVKALNRLHRFFAEELLNEKGGVVDEAYAEKLLLAINNDLDTPKAIAILWELVKDDNITTQTKRATMLHFDKVLGLGLIDISKSNSSSVNLSVKEVSMDDAPDEVKKMIREREKAREEKNWSLADELRDKIKEKGYEVKDTKGGFKITVERA